MIYNKQKGAKIRQRKKRGKKLENKTINNFKRLEMKNTVIEK
jgi:hypothetical protein